MKICDHLKIGSNIQTIGIHLINFFLDIRYGQINYQLMMRMMVSHKDPNKADLHQLSHLIMIQCKMDDESAIQLFKGRWAKLESLNLSYNYITNRGIKHIRLQNWQNLRILSEQKLNIDNLQIIRYLGCLQSKKLKLLLPDQNENDWPHLTIYIQSQNRIVQQEVDHLVEQY